jgi:hypothetical protein
MSLNSTARRKGVRDLIRGNIGVTLNHDTTKNDTTARERRIGVVTGRNAEIALIVETTAALTS